MLRMIFKIGLLMWLFGVALNTNTARCDDAVVDGPDVLRRENLVAWCIVPFDAKQRTPEERAAMLVDLGIERCAYDWRERHVPTFEQEIIAYRKHGIEFFAIWGSHGKAFEVFQQYDLRPQIWQMLRQPKAEDQQAKIDEAVHSLLPLARRTQQMGSKLGIYNHGGWSGEPANMVAICEQMRELGHDHVGIVYNFHHGHDDIGSFEEAFRLMQPLLHCVNLNGMEADGDPKIQIIGRGDRELEMIRVVVESGYNGPIGILDHRPEADARESLEKNLAGLAKIRRQLKE